MNVNLSVIVILLVFILSGSVVLAHGDLGGQETGFIHFLAENHELILIIHLLGFALGLGTATITDIFFFKFLKDFRISRWEASIMHTLSPIIWFALLILLISGIGLYLPQAELLNQSPSFLVKMIIVLVIIVNGIFLNLYISPKMTQISFRKEHHHKAGELLRLTRIAFALGAISFVSWYSAAIVALLPSGIFDFPLLLLIYFLILVAAIIVSQILEYFFTRRIRQDK